MVVRICHWWHASVLACLTAHVRAKDPQYPQQGIATRMQPCNAQNHANVCCRRVSMHAHGVTCTVTRVHFSLALNCIHLEIIHTCIHTCAPYKPWGFADSGGWLEITALCFSLGQQDMTDMTLDSRTWQTWHWTAGHDRHDIGQQDMTDMTPWWKRHKDDCKVFRKRVQGHVASIQRAVKET